MMRQFAIVETFPLQNTGHPKNEFHKEVLAGSWGSFEFKVSNLTQIPWDSTAMIRSNYRYPDGTFSEFKFKKVTQGRRLMYVQIQIQVPDLCEEQVLPITFFFVTPQRNAVFGEQMVAVLHIRAPSLQGNPDVIASTDFSKRPVHSSHKLVDVNDEHYMFTFASQLSDQGFGSFEDCLTVLAACKGDLKQAQKQLSRIMFQKKLKD